MALAALLIGTVAGIAAFALALALGQSLPFALLTWWVSGTVLTLLPLVALARETGDADMDEDEDLVTA